MAQRKPKIEVPSSFESPESSLIARAEYDVTTCIAVVDIKAGPSRVVQYTYSFPPDVWEEWEQAESKGSYFSTVIRPMYAGRKKG